MPELAGQEIYIVSGMSETHTFTENAYLIGFEEQAVRRLYQLAGWPFMSTSRG